MTGTVTTLGSGGVSPLPQFSRLIKATPWHYLTTCLHPASPPPVQATTSGLLGSLLLLLL